MISLSLEERHAIQSHLCWRMMELANIQSFFNDPRETTVMKETLKEYERDLLLGFSIGSIVKKINRLELVEDRYKKDGISTWSHLAFTSRLLPTNMRNEEKFLSTDKSKKTSLALTSSILDFDLEYYSHIHSEAFNNMVRIQSYKEELSLIFEEIHEGLTHVSAYDLVRSWRYEEKSKLAFWALRETLQIIGHPQMYSPKSAQFGALYHYILSSDKTFL